MCLCVSMAVRECVSACLSVSLWMCVCASVHACMCRCVSACASVRACERQKGGTESGLQDRGASSGV